MRAGMEGTYRKPPRLCTRAGQQAARDRFTAHYRARRHAQAAATLQPLLDQCGEFMDGIAADRLRNDLALAQLRSSGPAQCLQTLEETRAGLLADEAALRDSLPPCDFDNYLATARATWHNIRVCTAARDRAR
jgi:hypothetical protein